MCLSELTTESPEGNPTLPGNNPIPGPGGNPSEPLSTWPLGSPRGILVLLLVRRRSVVIASSHVIRHVAKVLYVAMSHGVSHLIVEEGGGHLAQGDEQKKEVRSSDVRDEEQPTIRCHIPMSTKGTRGSKNELEEGLQRTSPAVQDAR